MSRKKLLNDDSGYSTNLPYVVSLYKDFGEKLCKTCKNRIALSCLCVIVGKSSSKVCSNCMEIDILKKQIELLKNGNVNGAVDKLNVEFKEIIDKLREEQDFIQKTNRGGEFMEEQK